MCCCLTDCLLVIIAIFFPPFPVWIKRGICSADSLISILLCCLGYFPGLIHSWYIISRYPSGVRYLLVDEEQILYVSGGEIRAHQNNHSHNHTHVNCQPPRQTPIVGFVETGPSGIQYGATDESIPPPEYTPVPAVKKT
ncbi:hypothetical protein BABINDRAFT_161435 [Babjeviella inositovora NRRL Y-12698]|uniref:Stress response RCI peptide n=1 Tax=Babjeviella inositovora NRRL Y-12698 TaxID=984486 RepID=A0A1E3QS10_9ASCO|nr:uncharacterized protein BABINDRAFT_161435 [Babjeviella inositovora NRRL Y-12698]ODQ79727.1 hypothetical protein BABINDRAFT_161435 [Babjeviella inositovora NRRL Y-12698]